MNAQLFAGELDWLERKRLGVLRDLDALKALLAKIESAPSPTMEEQTARFTCALRQIDGALGTLRRLDELREWAR